MVGHCFKEPTPLPRKSDKVPWKLVSLILLSCMKMAIGLIPEKRAWDTVVLSK